MPAGMEGRVNMLSGMRLVIVAAILALGLATPAPLQAAPVNQTSAAIAKGKAHGKKGKHNKKEKNHKKHGKRHGKEK
ncbi:MAG TPA: hypothetical protein VH370_05245 [Humisphaera sp.]|nr:hypothetical protein [Humisphaera sp.]